MYLESAHIYLRVVQQDVCGSVHDRAGSVCHLQMENNAITMPFQARLYNIA